MKRVSGKEMCKALERRGWTLQRVKASHHIYKKDGLTISVPVHRNQTLKKGMQRQGERIKSHPNCGVEVDSDK